MHPCASASRRVRRNQPCPTAFPRMRIREENCNMVLLGVVALCAIVKIAGCASLVGGPTEAETAYFAERAATRRADAVRPDRQKIIYVTDQPPIRVIGAPFVPNTRIRANANACISRHRVIQRSPSAPYAR